MEKTVTLTCQRCANTFDKTIRTRGRYTAYCSPSCRAVSTAAIKVASRLRRKAKNEQLARFCVMCAAPFSATSAQGIVCGDECRTSLAGQLRGVQGKARKPLRCECWSTDLARPPRAPRKGAAPTHPDLFDAD